MKLDEPVSSTSKDQLLGNMAQMEGTAFQFVANADARDARRNHQSPFQRSVSAPAPAPLSPGGNGHGNKNRIRVQAGDKCVAPGKSKPKKRKTLAPPDENGLSMDCVEWSSRIYTVRQLVQHYGSKFPVIVRVQEGYHAGEAGLDLSVGQVLQIHSFGEQERCKARTAKSHLLSVPLNHQLEVLFQDRKETMELEDALRRFPLPVLMEVLNVNENAHGSLLNLVGGELHVIEKYDDIFLKANIITDGWIDQSNIHTIPSFLEVKLEVALSMHGATPAEWEDYYNMFSRSVRHLNFKRVSGYQGAASLDMTNPRDSTDVRVDLLPTNVPENLYQNSRERVTRNVFTNRAFSPNNNDDDEPRPVTPLIPVASQAQPDDLYQNLRMASPKLPPKQKHLPPRKDNKLPMTSPKPKLGHHQRNYQSESGDELDVTEMFHSVIKVAEEEEHKRTLESERNKRNKSNLNDSPGQSGVPHYGPSGNPPPRLGPFVVMVDVCNTFDRDDNKNNRRRNNAHPPGVQARRFNSLDEVPSDVEGLSVSEICECLELMNMGGHVEDFRRHHVDGKKLKGIKEAALQKNYAFNPFNASKLTRFVRGWRQTIS